MSDIARGNVEILVYTTAPSLGRDDTRYRALAQAYLDFRPAKRRWLGDIPIDANSQDINIRAGSQSHQSTQEERESEASWRPDEDGPESMSQQQPQNDFDRQDITDLLNSPDLSFMSVMDNRASPAFRGQITCRPAGSQSSRGSWQAPRSEVPDSQPDIIPTLAAFSTPTRILEVFLQNQDNSQSTSLSGPSPTSDRHHSSGLKIRLSSQKSSISSSQARQRSSNEQSSSLEASNEGRSSSQSLPQNRNENGSPELRGSIEKSSASETNPPTESHGKSSLEVEVGTNGSSRSFYAVQMQNQNGDIPSVGIINTSDPLSSFDVLAVTSSPSPVRAPPKPPLRVLRSKSPNTPVVQEFQPGKKRKLLGSIPETQIPASAPPALAMDDLQSTSRPAKKPRLEPTSSMIEARTRIAPSSAPVPQSPKLKTTIWTDRLEIRPRPPETSVGELKAEMLISPKLHTAAQRMPLASYFTPIKQTRDLLPMERGYWLVNCSTWTEEVRVGCWNFLGELVGNGLAGWGVWCVRDAQFETIRVYCWGIVVGHIYLVLIAGSYNRIKKSDASWIAGDGKTIIRMPS
ncbi:uncharacterized protein LY89DRAFT_689010 [Mollisia scopiformis]|uniref:Uncharacterized protein n=1 Tax=Mollisia scopiformis TaxID=149040 RepID=A0A194WSY0_MOLSC|nr:uncharacterized protein LY89DRAFT_689010 [Mollisia scopiformis]KUJ11061.1 hypothetical protein LY89DRAFT_689010 [Mollisia scopiformis]